MEDLKDKKVFIIRQYCQMEDFEEEKFENIIGVLKAKGAIVKTDSAPLTFETMALLATADYVYFLQANIILGKFNDYDQKMIQKSWDYINTIVENTNCKMLTDRDIFENDKKYELTDKTIEIDGHTLHQIRALKKFGEVEKGDLGGYVESEKNLSQEGNCWIYDKAIVYGNSEIYEDAELHGYAKVYENANVYGNAKVHGGAEVHGYAEVYENANVHGGAIVHGGAKVYGNSEIYGNSNVCEHAEIYGNSNVCEHAEIYGNSNISSGSISSCDF